MKAQLVAFQSQLGKLNISSVCLVCSELCVFEKHGVLLNVFNMYVYKADAVYQIKLLRVSHQCIGYVDRLIVLPSHDQHGLLKLAKLSCLFLFGAVAVLTLDKT